MTALFPHAKPRQTAPYRNDVVGSFLRTDALKTARAQYQAGAIDKAQLDAVTKAEISKLVAEQKGTWATSGV